MMRALHRGRRAGAAALEFALCLPIILVILGGVADLSQFVSLLQIVSRATRDGARIGSVKIEGATPTGDLIEADSIAHAYLLLAEAGYPCGADCSVTAQWEALDDAMFVRVRVEYPYEPYVGLTRFLADNATAEFVMLTQQQL
jgi:hypothetical protein